MKMIKKKLLFCLLAAIVMMYNACNSSELEDFNPGGGQNLKLSAMAQTGAVIKESSTVDIPLDIALSNSSGTAFEVELLDNRDTVQKLINNGTLDANTILLPAGTYQFPNVLGISYGVKKSTFKVAVNINTIEKNYGKKVAFAIKLSAPSKGNSIEVSKETFVVVLDTKTLLTLDDIRYVSFESGINGRYTVPESKNYSVTSAGIVIPVKLRLSGNTGGPGFSVKLALNQDTIGQLIGKGLLPPNTIPTNRASFAMDTVVKFAANQTEAVFNITFPLAYIGGTTCCYNVLSVNLKDATRNLIDQTDKNLIILINSADLAVKDITTDGSTLIVSKENDGGPNAGEGSSKLIDNNVNTKYLIGNFGGVAITLKYNSLVTAKAYTMTSGNDADDRDPKSWTLEGSSDGNNWIILDKREGEVFSDRTQTKRYEFTNNGSYLYYKLNIIENAGSNDFQFSEFRLIQLP
jgi:hypothetical protein